MKLTPSLDGYPNQYSLPCLDPETPSNLTHTPSHTPSLFSPYPTAPGRTPICPVESKLWKLPRICLSAGTHEIGYDMGMF